MRAVVSAATGQWPARDVYVDADPGASAQTVVDELAVLVGAEGPDAVAIDSARGHFAPDAPALGDAAPFDIGITDGARVFFGPRRASPRQEHGAVELVTVTGPGTGTVQPVPVGRTTLGVGSAGHIAVGRGVHSPVAMLTVAFDGTATVRLVGSADGARYLKVSVEEEPVTHEPSAWHAGSYLHVGESVLRLRRSPVGAGELDPDAGTASLGFNRPPRITPVGTQRRFSIPAPPKPPQRGAMPWIMALAPVIIGVVMALMWHQAYFLMFAVMSPVMMVGNWLSNRRNGVKTHRQALKEHAAEVAEIRAAISRSATRETALRRQACPDPSDLAQAATMPTRGLWERRRSGEDFLRLRVGTGNLPSGIEVTDNSELEYKRQRFDTLHDVPVTVDLDATGVVGVAGPGAGPGELARWLVGQLAVLHLPRDVAIYVLAPGERFRRWEWSRWLPHVLGDGTGAGPMARLGRSAETITARVGELTAILEERRIAAEESHGRVTFDDVIVTVLDGARSLRSLPGVLALLRDGPELGMYTICCDESSNQLPEECGAEVLSSGSGLLNLRRHGEPAVEGIVADRPTEDWFETVARAMSPLREVGAESQSGRIPNTSRLLPLLGLGELGNVVADGDSADPDDKETGNSETGDEDAARTGVGRSGAALVADAWGLCPRSTSAVVGESFDGPLSLDISRDGPHALVAGTTGSGKSEFLQTFVASLASANRPDEMTFVLVDYKGGSAFAACRELPHTVGFVTDLDSHLAQRALTSLTAELVHRESLLAVVGAKDIEDYQRATDGTSAEKLPRLVIVIDEFAALVKELPDFVAGLVGVSQRGRSLGVHLVLATQRPSGVVTADIRANTNLRVALRVTDTAESNDVLDAPDAARIAKSTPGRAYARLGHTSLLPFQTARIGGRRRLAVADRAPEAFLTPLSLERFAVAPPARPHDGGAVEADRTDLDLLVEAMAKAARDIEVPAPRRPWLPPLRPVVPLAGLLGALPAEGVTGPDEPGVETVEEEPPLCRWQETHAPVVGETRPFTWGLTDLPASQTQEPLRTDLDEDSHLYLIGSPGSGRTQGLRTIAASAALANSPADVHIYGVDCGNGGLAALESLPHCGGVARVNQTDRAARILRRLRRMTAQRADRLADGSYSNIVEQRAAEPPERRMPHVILLIDRWESFTSTLGEIDNGALTDSVEALLRDGVSTGVHVVIAGDRTLLATRMSHLTSHKRLLRLDDTSDYTMANLKPRNIPDTVPEGRVFKGESGTESQIAVLDAETSGAAQAALIRRIGEISASQFPDVAPMPARIQEMPKSLSISQLPGYRRPRGASRLFAAIGVGGDDVTAKGPDLATDPTFLVAGPARSGRSTSLRAMAESLLDAGVGLVICAPMPSPLRDLEGRQGVRAVLTGVDITPPELSEAVDDRPGTVIVMDDAELLKDMPAATWLRTFIRDAAELGNGLLVGGDVEEIGNGFGAAWNLDVKRARRGVLLSPSNPYDGDLIGVRISRSVCSSRTVLGQGYAHFGSGSAETVRLAR